ncbi:MAG TPA: MFS transporter [Streptosporangiaceae bacterium]|jgi:MFS family permease|nr:MFS transporter [Streptosporangiaceae bacterium]
MATATRSQRTARTPAGAVAATAAAFTICMAGTTLSTPLYDIYSRRYGFQTVTITILFAVYAIGVVATLTVFGRLSDAVGRRPVLLAAVGISAAGSLILAFAPGLSLLLVGRVVSGLAAGLMSGTGTAAVIDLFPSERRGPGATVAVAANTGGLALGTLLAGILAEVAPKPLITPYLVQAGLAVLAGLWLLLAAGRLSTAAAAAPGGRRFRLGRLRIPAEIRAPFIRAVLAAGAGFAVLGVLTSVSSVFLATILHIDNHALAGGVVALAFAFMAVGQLAARRAEPQAALLAGCGGLCVAAAILLLSLTLHSLAALVIAAIVLGIAEGSCLNAGIASTVERVPPDLRGEVSSSYFAGLYIFLALPAIGVGVLSAHTGLVEAGVIFCAVVIALAAIVGASQGRHRTA